MNDFDFDCKEKKRIASNARRMKNGSKSRKCSLSTDYMTEAQWKKKNGEVKVMSMNEPISFEQLKAMPADLQKEYIDKMISRFGCNMTALAKFFGLNPKEIKKLVTELRIDPSHFRRGLRMSAEQVAAFDKWCDNAITKLIAKPEPASAAKTAPQPAVKAIERKESHIAITMEPRNVPVEQKSNSMSMSRVAATFAGQLNIEQIRGFLDYATGGKPAYITITVGELKQHG